MKSLAWNRTDLIRRTRHDLWRHLTPAADIETDILQASALLQMNPVEVRTLGVLQFLISDELGHLLNYLPFLLRRLATTTQNEEEISADRIRGSVQWGRTLGLRYATGITHAYVTAPSRRAYQTPENELLVMLLDATVRLARETGWAHSDTESVGRLVAGRAATATEWLQSRMLLEIERRPLNQRELARIRAGRFKQRYGPVLDAYAVYSNLVRRLDRQSIRDAIESYGLTTRDDPTLFEIHCTFEVIKALREVGWRMSRLGLFRGSLRMFGTRGGQRLEVTYQRTPPSLGRGSRYAKVQAAHGITIGVLRPDLVLRLVEEGQERWLIVEVKGGHRPIEESARAAAYDLLAYRRAFGAVLHEDGRPYGLGICWGAELEPYSNNEIILTSPDVLPKALDSCGI